MALNAKKVKNKPNGADLLIEAEKKDTKNFSNDIRDNIKKELGITSLGPKTSKQIEDIDIDLIDEYAENEKLFGYDNYDLVKNSIKETGTSSVSINVFSLDNGRYVCYSGNTRLKVLKDMGEKKATCIIDGHCPDERKLKLFVLLNNIQREIDPYHKAINIQSFEDILRHERGIAGDSLTEEVGKYTNLKKTMIYEYKKILKLPEPMQVVFQMSGIPIKKTLKLLSMIPEDKIEEFMNAYNELDEETISIESIEKLINTIVRPVNNINESKNKAQKIGKLYKNISSIIRNEDGTYYVEPEKRAKTLEEINRLEEQLKLLKEACNK
jgi:hypothetical protein